MNPIFKYLIGGLDVAIIYMFWPLMTGTFTSIWDEAILGIDKCRDMILIFYKLYSMLL